MPQRRRRLNLKLLSRTRKTAAVSDAPPKGLRNSFTAKRRGSASFALLVAFLIPLAAIVAQDPTAYLNPDVLRVGDKLACRCGGCRNTVGNCPMLHCDFTDPMRQRIYGMQSKGMSDKAIINAIVREQGIVALASPPAEGFGPILTWVMPGVALLIGFWIYSTYIRRNRKEPEPLTAVDRAVIDRFHVQIERELGEEAAEPDAPGTRQPQPPK